MNMGVLGLDLQERFQEHRVAAHSNGPDLRQTFTTHLEETFRQLVYLARPELVLEIGAHEASFSRRVKMAIPDAQVYAFEAHPEIHQRFVSDCTTAGVTYEHRAVLASSGPVTFKVPLRKDGQEIRIMASTRALQNSSFSEYEVDGIALDDRFDPPPASSAVWVDVEGAAHDVVTGGAAFFKTCRIAYFEVETVRKWKGQKVFSELAATLAECGLYPVLRDIQRAGWQFNVIFLQETMLDNPATEEVVGRHFDLLFSY